MSFKHGFLTTVVVFAFSACTPEIEFGDDAEIITGGTAFSSDPTFNILPYCWGSVHMNHDEMTIDGVTYSASGNDQLVPDGIEGKFEGVDGSFRTTAADEDEETPPNTVDEGAVKGDWQWTDTLALECSEPSCGTGEWFAFAYVQASDVGDMGACANYNPISITFERSLKGDKKATSLSSCQAGSGRFQLIPFDFIDQNANGMARAVYRAAQISGTGTMTNGAIVSAIDVVQDGGAPLRVLKAGAEAKFTAADLLVTPSVVSYGLGLTNSFTSTAIDGMPVFLHPPISDSSAVNAKVDMTWTCGTATTVTRPQGYTFRTSDLGCPGTQKVTFRKVGDLLRFELYGSVNNVLDTTLDSAGNFNLVHAGFSAQGRLLSSSSTGASLQLITASAGGQSTCTAGTYSIGIEQ